MTASVTPLTKKKRPSSVKRMDRYLNAVHLVQGDPIVFNPFKQLRTTGRFTLPQYTQEDLTLDVTTGYTIQELADLAGISKQALIRTEQGCYTEPPERIVDYWVEKRDCDYTTLTNGYFLFVTHTRRRHEKLFGAFPDLVDFQHARQHPMKFLRSLWTNPFDETNIGTMNITEMAKLLCLSQSMLDHFENHPRRQQTVPAPLVQALRDNTYTSYEVGQLQLAYEWYRDYISPVGLERTGGDF